MTLFPRGITLEMLEELRTEHRDPGNCDNTTPALTCLSNKLLDEAHRIIEQGANPRNGLLVMLAVALSTGIEVARATPEWSLAAQGELEEWFSSRGDLRPPTSHEVLKEVIQDFTERHPLEVTNEEQDITREKVGNEHRGADIDPAYEAAQAEADR